MLIIINYGGTLSKRNGIQELPDVIIRSKRGNFPEMMKNWTSHVQFYASSFQTFNAQLYRSKHTRISHSHTHRNAHQQHTAVRTSNFLFIIMTKKKSWYSSVGIVIRLQAGQWRYQGLICESPCSFFQQVLEAHLQAWTASTQSRPLTPTCSKG
jgi:hypothetical protein